MQHEAAGMAGVEGFEDMDMEEMSPELFLQMKALSERTVLES